MRLFVTRDSMDFLTIGDDDASFIAMRVADKGASILSIWVTPEKRRRGIGTALLKAAEKTLAERGIFFIHADHLGSTEGVREFLVNNRFDVTEGTEIIDIKDLLKPSNPVLEKLMKQDFADLRAICAEELSISQWGRLLDFLSANGVDLTCLDLAFLDQRISTVIFDKKDRICSVILGSIHENRIYLELLLSRKGAKNMHYTFAVLKCVTEELVTIMEKREIDGVLLLACNQGVTAFVENIRNAGGEGIVTEKSLEAYKITYKRSYKDVEPAELRMDESTESEWLRVLAHDPMQHIISWKLPWYRTYQKHEILK